MALFKRTKNGFIPTDAGKCYLEAATSILNTNNFLEQQLYEIKNEQAGTLRVGIPRHSSAKILSSVLPKFYEAYPHVRVKLREVDSFTLISELRSNALDICFSTIIPEYPDLKYQLLRNEEFGILTGSESPLAREAAPYTPIDFLKHAKWKFVAFTKGQPLREIFDSLFIANGIKPDIVMETRWSETAFAVAIACGFYVVCSNVDLPENSYFYPLKDYSNKWHFYVCHRAKHYLPAYEKYFLKLSEHIFPSI